MPWTLQLHVILSCVYLTHGQTSSEKLSVLADDFQSWRLQENPETATTRGIYTYNDRLSDYNVSRYDGYKAIVDGFHTRLMAIQEADLSRGDRNSYKVLQHHLETFRDGYQWRFYKNLNPINFLEGLLYMVQRFPSRVPVDTKGDVENYYRRLQAWPTQISEIQESLGVAMLHNTTNHHVTMVRLGVIFDRVLGVTNVNQSDLYIPFRETVEMNKLGYLETERQELIAKATTAVATILESMRRLRSFIENDYVTRPDIGVSSFTRGQEYYKAIMKWYLSLDLTPEQVHETGKREVARISSLMQQIMLKQSFSGTIKEYFGSLMNNTSSFYNTADELLDGYRKQIADIEPELPKLFTDLPGLPVIVKPMTSDGPQGTYDRGSPDGSIPGTFWANAIRPQDIPKFGMMALTIHETNPGHHLQISYAMTSNLPAFRRSILHDRQFESPVAFTTFTAYTEGWALYAESLGEEVGLYKDDYELMGRYSSEIFRACRLVVDTGMHYFSWDRERAVNYVLNYTAFTRATAETEIDRYITWPGQALTYKIGELKIKELRKKAERKLGKAFDVREFHKVILENGRMPLSLLEENVNDWLDNYVPMTTTPTQTCETSGSSEKVSFRHLTFLKLVFMSILITRTISCVIQPGMTHGLTVN